MAASGLSPRGRGSPGSKSRAQPRPGGLQPARPRSALQRGNPGVSGREWVRCSEGLKQVLLCREPRAGSPSRTKGLSGVRTRLAAGGERRACPPCCCGLTTHFLGSSCPKVDACFLLGEFQGVFSIENCKISNCSVGIFFFSLYLFSNGTEIERNRATCNGFLLQHFWKGNMSSDGSCWQPCVGQPCLGAMHSTEIG